ncbi:MAG: cation:proton antiporter, partial [candidate division WOR-3 bacterium]
LGNIRSLRGYVPHAAAVLRPTNLNDRERAFLSEATFLLKTFFFVYIGLSLRLADVRLLLSGLALSLLIFLLRIPVVRLSLGRTTRQSDAILAAVIVPKGLAAAVLAALPAEAGLAGGQLIRDSVFAAILFTVLFTAVLAFLVEAGIIPNLYQAMFHHYSASSDLTLLPHGPAVTPTDESPPTGSRD